MSGSFELTQCHDPFSRTPEEWRRKTALFLIKEPTHQVICTTGSLWFLCSRKTHQCFAQSDKNYQYPQAGFSATSTISPLRGTAWGPYRHQSPWTRSLVVGCPLGWSDPLRMWGWHLEHIRYVRGVRNERAAYCTEHSNVISSSHIPKYQLGNVLIRVCFEIFYTFVCYIHVRINKRRYPMVSLEFFCDIILPAAAWPWGRQASNRNEKQEYFLGDKGGRCAGLTNLLPPCADCLEIWDPQPPGTPRACPGLCRDCLIFINILMYCTNLL